MGEGEGEEKVDYFPTDGGIRSGNDASQTFAKVCSKAQNEGIAVDR